MRYVAITISLLLSLVGCTTPEGLLRQTRDLRLAGDMEKAVPRLESMLVLRNQRGKALSAATTRALTTEVTEATRFLTGKVDQHLRAGLPLSAQAVCRQRATLLAQPEFSHVNHEVQVAIAGAGQQICARLTATGPGPSSPYWSHLLEVYCAHWGTRTSAPFALPDLLSRIVVTGPFEGDATGDLSSLASLIQSGFRESVWYGPGSAQSATAEVSGAQNVAFSQRPVTLQANWTEQVPYLMTEFYQEPYQQSYTDTEYYTVQVPYFTTESYSYSCGFGSSYRSCTGTRSVSKTRSESRSRMVTKWRTAYRNATRLVTRYQPTPRVFSYVAIEHSGQYSGEFRVALRLGMEVPPLLVVQQENRTESGLLHDVTFAPAGIEPSLPGLTSREGWVGRQLVQMRDQLAAALSARWSARFCAATEYSGEEAARCAYLRAAGIPPEARRVVEGSFGQDAVLALGLLARSNR
jgi:hypothetical protein